MSEHKSVKLEEIRVNPVALRDVNKDSIEFQNLVRDIKRRGLLLPVTVIPKSDELTNETYYLLVDGLQRYTAMQECDAPTIDVHVLDIDEAEVMETQIAANLLRINTKPIEYTRGLQRMMQSNPTMTTQELATKISQSVTFVNQRMSLLRLAPEIQKLVDDGEIGIANACALSKVPTEHQHELTVAAQTQAPTEFVPACNERAKELRAAAREGREATEAKFEPKPRLRKLTVLREEMESPNVGPALVARTEATTAEEGFALGIKWALHLDPMSIEEGEAAFQASKEAREAAKQKTAAAREALRLQEAAAKAAEAQEKAGLSKKELSQLVKEEEARRAAAAAAKAAAKAEEEVPEEATA